MDNQQTEKKDDTAVVVCKCCGGTGRVAPSPAFVNKEEKLGDKLRSMTVSITTQAFAARLVPLIKCKLIAMVAKEMAADPTRHLTYLNVPFSELGIHNENVRLARNVADLFELHEHIKATVYTPAYDDPLIQFDWRNPPSKK